MRRPLLALGLAAVVVASHASPAFAATLSFQAPQSGSSIGSGDVPIVVRVDRGLGETVTGVEVRLRPDGGGSLDGGRVVPLECVDAEGCGNVGDTQESWGGVRLSPDAAPFTTREVCNGAYRLEARTEGATAWAATTQVVLTDGVAGPDDVRVEARDTTVTVTWAPRPSSDVRHVVQRRSGSSPWSDRAELPHGADRFEEQVAAGTYDYRVVAVRGDGWIDGVPAVPCADDDRDLEAAGPARSITVATGTASTGRPATAAPSASPAPGGPTEDATEQPAPGSDGGDADGRATAPAGRRIAPPPPAQGTAPRASAPGLRAVPDDRPRGERSFGENGGFDEELAYDGIEAVVGDDGSLAQRLLPDGLASVTTLDIELRRILTSVAAGLVMITLALHLRRWSREA